ncbi:PepSY domain-containing protein [Methylobacterium radiodurans]|uniref:PepSY domain-containing protein n=1 Tax=Methylobacterium radiodurans TaxID=2202828 RepID=UPI001FE87EE9|nr:PepSY domain-containing protein [Methylobacterium radiodurans]
MFGTSDTETANETDDGLRAGAGFRRPGEDWIRADQVNQRLADAGYTSITELEAEDGHWEGEGIKNGVTIEFHVDPNTGAIANEKPDRG